MASGTTGTMRSEPQAGGYLADLIARWLGMGGGGAQAPAGGTAMPGGPPAPAGVPGIGLLGPNASLFDDYGGGGALPLIPQSQGTTQGRGHENYTTKRQGTPGMNVPRVGVSPSPVPGVNAGVPGSRAAPTWGASSYSERQHGPAGSHYGGGSAADYLAAILGGGGRY